jgi:hypothetical protein
VSKREVCRSSSSPATSSSATCSRAWLATSGAQNKPDARRMPVSLSGSAPVRIARRSVDLACVHIRRSTSRGSSRSSIAAIPSARPRHSRACGDAAPPARPPSALLLTNLGDVGRSV